MTVLRSIRREQNKKEEIGFSFFFSHTSVARGKVEHWHRKSAIGTEVGVCHGAKHSARADCDAMKFGKMIVQKSKEKMSISAIVQYLIVSSEESHQLRASLPCVAPTMQRKRLQCRHQPQGLLRRPQPYNGSTTNLINLKCNQNQN